MTTEHKRRAFSRHGHVESLSHSRSCGEDIPATCQSTTYRLPDPCVDPPPLPGDTAAMLRWRTMIDVLRPLASCPRPLTVACERQVSPDYLHHGRYRQREHHCLLKITLAGRGFFRDASGTHALPPGHAFLCRINDPATSYGYPEDAHEPWDFLYCCFQGGASDAVVDEISARHGPIHILPLDHGPVRELLDWGHRADGHVIIDAAQGLRLVDGLVAALLDRDRRQTPEDPAGRLCRQALDMIHAQVGERLGVADIARHLGVSREHLTRVFHDEIGIAPARYLTRMTIIEACRLLKETRLSAAAISTRLGFCDPGHFGRVFKRVIGMTTSRFRAVGAIPSAVIGPREREPGPDGADQAPKIAASSPGVPGLGPRTLAGDDS